MVAKLNAVGFSTVILEEVIIFLGRNDATSSARAARFEENMNALTSALRIFIGDPTLPVTLEQIKVETEDADVATVKSEAAAWAAGDAYATLYSPLISGTFSWSEATPNGIHPDTATYEDMGEEIARL